MICTASAQESVPRWMAGPGPRLGDGRVRHAARLDRRAQAARRDARPPGRPDRRDPAPDRPLAARRSSTSRRSASAPSTSTATCCRPTAARAAPRSPAPTSRCRWPARRLQEEGRLERSPADGLGRGGLLRDRSTACRCSTSTTARTRAAEVDANVVMTGDGGLVEVQTTAERTPLSRAHLDELLALAAGGIARLRALQEQAIAAVRRHGLGERCGAAAAVAPCGCCWRPTTSTSAGSSSACWRRRAGPIAARRAAGRGRAAARGRRDVRRERARQGAGRGAGDRPGRASPTTRASPPRRSAARRGSARRATPASGPATRRTSPGCCARRRRAARWSTCARSPTSTRGAGVERLFEGRCAGAWPPDRAASGASATTLRSCPTTGPPGRRWPSSPTSSKDAISHRGRAARALLAWLEGDGRRGLAAAARRPGSEQVDGRRDRDGQAEARRSRCSRTAAAAEPSTAPPAR